MWLQNCWFRILIIILVLNSSNIQAISQVTENKIIHVASGNWTPWGPWIGCSSLCGEGVTLRTRQCKRDNMEVTCTGQKQQYKLCQSTLCPADSVPFRNVQCTLYNNRPIPGSSQRYHWVPFYGAPNPCHLNCLAVGYNFYYSFGRALDGTSCGPHSDGTCVNGQCLMAGCDGILGSGVTNDSCGNCGGQNDSCVHVQDVFRLPYPSTGIFGYKNVTRIPAGATHIKVTDRSRNILALMSLSKGYVINGDWAMSRSGVYKVAGTEVHYTRVTASHEFLEALGPTDEDLYVLVLFQEQNPGIEYEYWLPKDNYYNLQRDSQATHKAVDFVLEAWVRTPTSTSAGDTAKEESKKKPHPSDKTDCQQCMQFKGRSQRKKHYCQSDFVIRGKILGQKTIGQETRYDIHIKHVYKNKFPLVHREYIWVSNKCDCPKLKDHKEYIMMPSRHVNYEHTLNRILLTINSYVKRWSQHEDYQVERLSRSCRTSS
ncbi:ADAMTS-like protein 5 [Bufo gargarizans]|uniref:ADAMTS-like protein 5 n=1 Tax=Bufo gargarizans TaxID=30331 RepID=UPI001CF55F30|nr:ADAMTS-like protein 5 [Bufo gargarizans]